MANGKKWYFQVEGTYAPVVLVRDTREEALARIRAITRVPGTLYSEEEWIKKGGTPSKY